MVYLRCEKKHLLLIRLFRLHCQKNLELEILNETPIEQQDSFQQQERASFFISLYEKPITVRKAGYALSLSFSVSQHIKDKELLERLAINFQCGIVRESSIRDTAEWIVTKYADLRDIIIPFLNENKLAGVKASDLKGLKKAICLMEDKVHLTKEGYTQFKEIKDGMYKEMQGW